MPEEAQDAARLAGDAPADARGPAGVGKPGTRNSGTVGDHRARDDRSKELGTGGVVECVQSAAKRVDKTVARGLEGTPRRPLKV